MPPILQQFIPLFAAAALAFMGYMLTAALFASSRTQAEKALADFSRPVELPKSGQDAPMGSPEYKIRLGFSGFGLNVAGWEQIALYGTCALVGVGLAVPILIVGLPPVLAIAAPFLGYVGINAYIDDKWDAVRLQMDKELPTMLTRLSSLLKANPNLIETLDNVAEGLDPEKPLQAWIRRFAARLQASGRQGLEETQAEAERISPALLLAVVEIGRLWETGGSGYIEALRQAAVNMADLMETRSQASAVAAGAWGTARTILLALGFTLGTVLVNPVSKPAFQTPLMQGVMLAALVWAGFGYWNIKDAIADVVE